LKKTESIEPPPDRVRGKSPDFVLSPFLILTALPAAARFEIPTPRGAIVIL
jgi:hypothetical protein